ncbi:hypothetical protein [Stenotrophomonas sp.]|uniref:hypothetical protein n=1 Tax=Stenotrophomonas sp. TaxID=69392 RepID=UPI0028AB28EC|nr:hypothetical protein [Stenotrophomonas sp.]
MTDDQQRARGLPGDLSWKLATLKPGSCGVVSLRREEWNYVVATLRAAPEVPAARVTEPLRADESRQEQADSAIYNRGWNDCRAAMLAARPQGVK